MNTENEMTGFRERIAVLIGKEEPFVWAKKIGLSGATFDRIWNGGSVPKADKLLLISRKCGVSVDWLLTGEATKAPDLVATTSDDQRVEIEVKASGGSMGLEADLYGLAAELVVSAYAQAGIPLIPRQLGKEMAEIAASVAEIGLGSREEKIGALYFAADQLRRRLQVSNPHDDQAQGKQGA